MTPTKEPSTGLSAFYTHLVSRPSHPDKVQKYRRDIQAYSGMWEETYHEAKMCPLAKEISIYIDAVGLTQVFGNERTNGRQVPRLQTMLILNILQVGKMVFARGMGHRHDVLAAHDRHV